VLKMVGIWCRDIVVGQLFDDMIIRHGIPLQDINGELVVVTWGMNAMYLVDLWSRTLAAARWVTPRCWSSW
jgi:hypothetical protein